MKQNKLPKTAKRVFKGEIFEVWQWPQKMYDGSVEIFEKLTRPDTVQAIPVFKDKILIIKQKQPHISRAYYSLAGGRREPGETVLNAAKRELLEETGYVSSDWRLLKKTNPIGKIVWTIYTYVARDCIFKQPPRLDSGEKIVTKLLSFDEFLALADEPRFDESAEFINYLFKARADKKIYKEFQKILF